MNSKRLLKFMMLVLCCLKTGHSWAMDFEKKVSNAFLSPQSQAGKTLSSTKLKEIEQHQKKALVTDKPQEENQRYQISYTSMKHAKQIIEEINSKNGKILVPHTPKLKSFFTCYIAVSHIMYDFDSILLDKAHAAKNPKGPALFIVREKGINDKFTINTRVRYNPTLQLLSGIQAYWDVSLGQSIITDTQYLSIAEVISAYNKLWGIQSQTTYFTPQVPPKVFFELMEKNVRYPGPKIENVPSAVGTPDLTPIQIKVLEHIAKFGFQFDDTKHSARPELSVIGIEGSDKQTAIGQSFGVDLAEIFRRVIKWDNLANDPEIKAGFQYLWSLRASYFPTKHLTADTSKILTLWTDEEKRQNINPVKEFAPLGTMLDGVDVWLRRYTTNNNQLYSILNFLLGAHVTHAMDPDNHPLGTLNIAEEAIRNIRNAVIYQTPKHKGKVYRGTVASPIEVFMHAYKGTTFFPHFVSTSLDKTKMYWAPHCDTELDRGIHNVRQVIDTSEFPDYSTIIQEHQSPYFEQERENLLACYNLLEFQKCKYDKRKNLFSTYYKVKNPAKHVVQEYNSLIYEELNTWMNKKGEISRIKMMDCNCLAYHVQSLFESYDRNAKKWTSEAQPQLIEKFFKKNPIN